MIIPLKVVRVLTSERARHMKKIVLTYGIRIVEEALALMRVVAQVTVPRDGSDAALDC